MQCRYELCQIRALTTPGNCDKRFEFPQSGSSECDPTAPDSVLLTACMHRHCLQVVGRESRASSQTASRSIIDGPEGQPQPWQLWYLHIAASKRRRTCGEGLTACPLVSRAQTSQVLACVCVCWCCRHAADTVHKCISPAGLPQATDLEALCRSPRWVFRWFTPIACGSSTRCRPRPQRDMATMLES